MLSKRVLLSMVAFVMILILACGGGGGVSNKVEDFAKEQLLNSNFCQNRECDNIKVSRAEEQSLSDADRANGLEGEWCVMLTYVSRANSNSNWIDDEFGYRIRQQNGELSVDIKLEPSGWAFMCD